MTMRLAVIGHGRQAKRYLEPKNGLGLCVAADELDHKPDGVIVANHPRDHYESTVAALSEGIPCLVEKPLAPTMERCADLITRAYEADTPLMVAHTLLFSRRFGDIMERAAGAKHIAIDIGGPRPNGHDYSTGLDWGPHAHSVGIALGANAITFGDYPERRATVTIDGIRHDLNTSDETDPTPMATQVLVFCRLIRGHRDWRANRAFTFAVYSSLFSLPDVAHPE